MPQDTALPLTLAQQAAQNEEPHKVGPVATALREVLANSLLHGPAEQVPGSLTETHRRAAWEAARLIDLARANGTDALLFAADSPVVAP